MVNKHVPCSILFLNNALAKINKLDLYEVIYLERMIVIAQLDMTCLLAVFIDYLMLLYLRF